MLLTITQQIIVNLIRLELHLLTLLAVLDWTLAPECMLGN